jgi:thiazole synthase ThiGH ThiG subunit
MAHPEVGSEVVATTLSGNAREFPAENLTLMRLGSGLLNPLAIRTIKHRQSVPVTGDAGAGTASETCVTMEPGGAGTQMNARIAAAADPVRMATA